MFVLPVSGRTVRFQAPGGHDEVLLAEAALHPLRLRVEAVCRLAPPAESGVQWGDLPFADVDAALLAFRLRALGDRLVAEIRCTHCAAWCDTALSISAYLQANRPRRVRPATATGEGWYAMQGAMFRAPTVSTVLNAVESRGSVPDAALSIMRETIDAQDPELTARAAAALEKIAPALAGPIRGTCPGCERRMRGWFDPGAFVLAELQARAGVVFEHVHLLAQAYGWTEDAILALPSRRRAAYADRIQSNRN